MPFYDIRCSTDDLEVAEYSCVITSEDKLIFILTQKRTEPIYEVSIKIERVKMPLSSQPIKAGFRAISFEKLAYLNKISVLDDSNGAVNGGGVEVEFSHFKIAQSRRLENGYS